MRVQWGDEVFTQEVADWLQAQFPALAWGRYRPDAALFILGSDDEPAGAIVMTGRNRFDAQLSIYAPGVRWTRADLAGLFRKCFDEMRLTRLTVKVSVMNAQSCRFVERLGFVREGTARLGYGGWDDLALYGMLRSDCRWLKD